MSRLAGITVAPSAEIAEILNSPEVATLVAELDELRWTGRRGYGSRALVGACLVKHLYAIPTWTRVARLIDEHAALANALGGRPSEWACYRFARKLRENKPLMDACLARIGDALRAQMPDFGQDVAVDASDLPAYANGQRFVSKGGRKRERFSDPDASWGHRSAVSTRKGGGFYGYKLSAAVCSRTGLPVAWRVETARAHESSLADDLLQRVRERVQPETVALDKGYDMAPVYDACARDRCRPDHPASTDAVCEARRSSRADLRARNLDVRRFRLQARRLQVALPDRRVRSEVAVDQGFPASSAHPARHEALARSVPGSCCYRARVRPVEASVRVGTASRSRTRSRSASR